MCRLYILVQELHTHYADRNEAGLRLTTVDKKETFDSTAIYTNN